MIATARSARKTFPLRVTGVEDTRKARWNERQGERADVTASQDWCWVHAVMHIGWIERSPGVFGPQLAVYVKPKDRLGRAYMAAIKPFRYLVVYPAMERATTAQWTMFDRC